MEHASDSDKYRDKQVMEQQTVPILTNVGQILTNIEYRQILTSIEYRQILTNVETNR